MVMKRTLSGSWSAKAVDALLQYALGFAIWYDWGAWIAVLGLLALLWFMGRCLREEAVFKSLEGFHVSERLLMCLFKSVYNLSYGAFVAFCILCAVDELDKSSGLLDWAFNQPVYMEPVASSALDNIKNVIVLLVAGLAGLRGYPRLMEWWDTPGRDARSGGKSSAL
jgi:hypothetical protein